MIEQAGDAVIITGKPILAAAYRAVLAGIRVRRADGLPWGDLQQLALALLRAHMSPERQEFDAAPDVSPCWDDQQSRDDWCTTGEAALLLGMSRRSVQRMARDPGGLEAVRVGRAWMVRKSAPLLVQAKERARRDRAG